ncbi:MAG TPA: arginine N-succinyltransferase [Gammaproteobacteria bacterium]|nr:arginine N-succinyltransferase [Gammaproteobacteria bacterium]
MPDTATDAAPASPARGISAARVVLIVLATILLTVGLTWWVLAHYVFVREFKPVTLDAREEQVLDRKLRVLGYRPGDLDAEGNLKPEPYSEVGARREVSFNERELNALLAKNTDLAKKLAIDLSDDLVSARLLIPMDPDFPVLGGKTLRVNAGVAMAYRDNKPVIVLKGVSIMGVPVPNAWLGGLKNIDLVQEFGNDQGFWKSFSEGVKDIRVEQGQIKVELKE